MERKTTMQQFAEFLKNKRIALGISQIDLAVKLYGNKNMRQHISRIESGKKDVTLKTVDVILQGLNSGIEFIE